MKRPACPIAIGLLLAGLLPISLPACKKSEELVPYGAVAGNENSPAASGPEITTKGPVKVKVTPPPAGSATGEVISCVGKLDKLLLAGQTANGGFGGVQVGAEDGARVILRQRTKVDYFALADEALAYFFVAHKPQRKLFDVAFDSIERCIQTAGGYLKMLKMTNARMGEITFKGWWTTLGEAGQSAAKSTFQKYVDGAFTP